MLARDSLIKPVKPQYRYYLFDSPFYVFKDGRGLGLVYEQKALHSYIGYFDSEDMFYRCLERNYLESKDQELQGASPMLYLLTCSPHRENAKRLLIERPCLLSEGTEANTTNEAA